MAANSRRLCVSLRVRPARLRNVQSRGRKLRLNQGGKARRSCESESLFRNNTAPLGKRSVLRKKTSSGYGVILSPLSSPTISSTDKIVFTRHPPVIPLSTHSTPPSQPPQGDSVKEDHSASSVNVFSATIPATPFTSFKTDNQQTWRTSLPSSTATAANQHSFTQDFQLFDSETPTHQQAQNLRGQATSNIAPNRPQQRHLSLNTRVSPFGQNTSSPSTNTHRSFSSPALQHAQYNNHHIRHQIHRRSNLPPVPAFTQSNANQRVTTYIPTTDVTMEFDSMFLPGSGTTLPTGEAFHMDFNDFTHDSGTISPHDLHNDSVVMSNPPSTAFPNLSTPDSSFLESPAMASSGLNTSPMDNFDSNLDFNQLDSLQPLFPQDSYDQFASVPDNQFHQSASFSSVNPRAVSATASPLVRQKSSPGRPPAPLPAHVHGRKHFDTVGIHKSNSNKAKKVLPEIHIGEEDDKETAKRKKNTAAARKSRQRKQDQVEQLTGEIDRLRKIVSFYGGDPDEDYPGID